LEQIDEGSSEWGATLIVDTLSRGIAVIKRRRTALFD
jgi:hypothetical protein